MKKSSELIISAFEEAKRQEEQRKEYILLVHELLDGTIRGGSTYDFSNTWRLSFKLHRVDNRISFDTDITRRNDRDLVTYDDINRIKKANEDINKCINYLYDCGIDKLEAFIDHLAKNAIPMFLQHRCPWDYII